MHVNALNGRRDTVSWIRCKAYSVRWRGARPCQGCGCGGKEPRLARWSHCLHSRQTITKEEEQGNTRARRKDEGVFFLRRNCSENFLLRCIDTAGNGRQWRRRRRWQQGGEKKEKQWEEEECLFSPSSLLCPVFSLPFVLLAVHVCARVCMCVCVCALSGTLESFTDYLTHVTSFWRAFNGRGLSGSRSLLTLSLPPPLWWGSWQTPLTVFHRVSPCTTYFHRCEATCTFYALRLSFWHDI